VVQQTSQTDPIVADERSPPLGFTPLRHRVVLDDVVEVHKGNARFHFDENRSTVAKTYENIGVIALPPLVLCVADGYRLLLLVDHLGHLIQVREEPMLSL
jgi:hypothetical protein